MGSEGWGHTWDGKRIAREEPIGSTVHVRRPAADGGWEVLLLHRSHEGPDYAGDWAWTSPAGARQPGEAVHPAACRELAEEAGITGLDIWPHDLSTRWATWVVDVGGDLTIDLVDPEHDQWRWASVEEAGRLALPPIVGEQYAEMRETHAGGVTFAPLVDDDLERVVRWQNHGPAAEWFVGGPASVDEARRRYAARLSGDSATTMWRVDIEGEPAGYAQAYRVADYDDYAVKTGDPAAVGIDYLIGEEHLVGRRWGRTMIWAFIQRVLLDAYPDAPRFLASPDHRNQRSIRSLERCGFRPGLWIDVPADRGHPPCTEVVCTFDRAHWIGDREPQE